MARKSHPAVRLIHWKAEEVPARKERLEAAGYAVESDLPGSGAELLKVLRAAPPAAVVIDLGRLPSHGRDVGLGVRASKATRYVPLVFVGGSAAKVRMVRETLPDASFTTWAKVAETLAAVLADPPTAPVVPESSLAGYSGTPLAKKLMIKPGCTVALVEAPDEFESILGELPPDVVLRRNRRGKPDTAIWFVRSLAELKREIGRMGRLAPRGLWIAWPKKASRVETDVGEAAVRAAGLAAGLVDHKICAIDATWSGLRFVERR